MNCISALQEIWNSESSTSEEAAREKEGLISKPFVYYLLNRYVLLAECKLETASDLSLTTRK